MTYVDTVDTPISKTIPTPVVRRTSITPATWTWSWTRGTLDAIWGQEEQTILDIIKTLFTEIVQETELSDEPTFKPDVTEKFNLAVKLMNHLNETTSFKQIVDMATNNQNKRMRNMIVMALTNCRSWALVESLTSIEPKLKTWELAEIISGLSINGIPTSDLLHELKKVYVTINDDMIKEQTLLAIGAQLHELCRPHRVYGLEKIVWNWECTDGIKTEFTNVSMNWTIYRKVLNLSKLIL